MRTCSAGKDRSRADGPFPDLGTVFLASCFLLLSSPPPSGRSQDLSRYSNPKYLNFIPSACLFGDETDCSLSSSASGESDSSFHLESAFSALYLLEFGSLNLQFLLSFHIPPKASAKAMVPIPTQPAPLHSQGPRPG